MTADFPHGIHYVSRDGETTWIRLGESDYGSGRQYPSGPERAVLMALLRYALDELNSPLLPMVSSTLRPL